MTNSRAIIDPRWIAIFVAVAVAVFVVIPAIHQDETYHLFADSRTIFGIPNFWNVISNLPFLLVGAAGFRKARTTNDRALFTGVFLTAFGSAYYHLCPNDARLIWDRIPMTVIFMAFVCCALEDDQFFIPLIAAGIGSVLWWSATGDLRPYGIVKFGPILLLAPAIASNPKRRYMIAILSLFGLAQIFELSDRAVYGVVHLSGHSIKHVIAGAATCFMLNWRFEA